MLTRHFEPECERIEQKTFSHFCKQLTLPSSLHPFRLSPLPGQGLLAFPPGFVSMVVECLFGGSGTSKPRGGQRGFTSIEERLMQKFAAGTLEVLAEQFARFQKVRPLLLETEHNPLQLQCAAPSDRVFIAKIEAEHPFYIGISQRLLEPLQDHLEIGSYAPTKTADRRVAAHIPKVSVELRAELAKSSISFADILGWKVGDIINLGVPADEPATVYVEGVPKFKARVGQSRGSKAIMPLRIPWGSG